MKNKEALQIKASQSKMAEQFARLSYGLKNEDRIKKEAFFSAIDNANIFLSTIAQGNKKPSNSEITILGQLLQNFFSAYAQIIFLTENISDSQEMVLDEEEDLRKQIYPYIKILVPQAFVKNSEPDLIYCLNQIKKGGIKVDNYFETASLKAEMLQAITEAYKITQNTKNKVANLVDFKK